MRDLRATVGDNMQCFAVIIPCFKKNNNNKQTGNITISSNIEALLHTAESSRPGRRTRVPAAVYLVSISRVVDNSGLGLLIWGGREVEERSVQSRGRLGRLLGIKGGKTGNKSAGGRREMHYTAV